MNTNKFREFLQEKKLDEGNIEQCVMIAERFADYVKKSAPTPDYTPTLSDIEAFSAILIRESLNVRDNYIALAYYGQFVQNNDIFRAAIEVLDGREVMDNLYQKLADEVGTEKRDEVFAGIDLPPLGITPVQKAEITTSVMASLEKLVDPETCQKLLAGSLRSLPEDAYLEDRQKYLESKDIDAFLARRGEEFIAYLEQLQRNGKLFFTQEVTEEVIEFVRENPIISQGVREGNIIYEVKIPYMTKEYLAETDEQLKKYHYCHCPWARESIKKGDAHVSPTFCNCSAGFVKKPWEVMLGQPLEAEIVESVLTGGQWCKIAIHLPEHVVEKKTVNE